MKRKGFTLVELLVVIAIIAILATVSIVGYTAFTRKASMSNDEAVITQMNLSLEGFEILDERAKYPQQAVDQCISNGFIYQNLKPQSKKHKILYDSVANRFCLYSEEADEIVFYNEKTNIEQEKELFFECVDISETKADSYERALYLFISPDKTIDNSWKNITTNKSIDTGMTDGVKEVNYINNEITETEGKNVIIATSSYGSELTVNAPYDVIYHYGKCGSANIIAVAKASYHEYGSVPFVEIASGRIALEQGAEVEQLHFDVSTLNEGTKDEVIAFDEIIVAYDETVTLPTFSRDCVNIAETGTLVVELQSDTNNDDNTDSDYIWLFKQGTISQMVVADNEISGIKIEGTKLVDVADSSTILSIGVADETKTTQKAAVEIANNYNGKSTNGSISIGEGENSKSISLPKLDANFNIIPDSGKTIKDSIEDTGYSTETKNEKKTAIVEKYYVDEQAEKEEEKDEPKVCETHTWDETKTVEVKPTCFEKGSVKKTCSVCGYVDIKISKAYGHTKDNPNIIGIYCNYCHHPVAFVDEITDFTTEQEKEEPQLMRIIDISQGLNLNTKGYLYLDIAYSFKAFPDMNNQVLDNEQWYQIDPSTFVLTECKDKYTEDSGIHIAQNGMFVTAQGVYNFFSTWLCDYYVSFSGDIKAKSCGLGGYYESWEYDLGFLAPIDIPANAEIPLLGYLMSNGQSNWTYADIIEMVGEFKCGFFNISDENIGETFTVKLRMLNPQAENGYSSQYAVDMGGFYLPSYIDVAVTNYKVTAISDANAEIVRECAADLGLSD